MPKSIVRHSSKLNRWKSVITSPVFSVVIGFAVIVIAVSLTKEVIRQYRIRQEVATLEAQIQTLEDSNADLSSMLAYFQSSSFEEKQSRQKLGLKGEGETVVVFPQEAVTVTAVPTATSTTTPTVEVSHLDQWKNYFFK